MKKTITKSIIFTLIATSSTAPFAYAQRGGAAGGAKINDQVRTKNERTDQAGKLKTADTELMKKIGEALGTKITFNPDSVAKITSPDVLVSLKSFFGSTKIKNEIAEQINTERAEVEKATIDLFDISTRVSSRLDGITKTDLKTEGLVESAIVLSKLAILGSKALKAAGLESTTVDKALKLLKETLDGEATAPLDRVLEVWFGKLKDKGLIDRDAKFEDWMERLRKCLGSLL